MLRMNDTILVYQMGKVGSSTIHYSIKQAGLKSIQFHRYFFSNNEKSIRTPRRLITRLKTIFSVKKCMSHNKIKVITVFRDPLSRNISSFFQNLTSSQQKLDTEELITQFESNKKINRTVVSWFKDEFEKLTGVDIFKYSFDQKSGYQIIKERNIEVLVLTLEKLSDNEDIIKEFLNAPNFSLENKNIGEKKKYNSQYSDFKRNFIPTATLLEYLYHNKVVNHFYDKEQIDDFKSNWQGKI